MGYQIAEDVKPQFKLLVLATVFSVAIWLLASWFMPSLNYVFYPLQLFATFVHESSHVLAAVITGSTVQSLSVAPDTSGVVWSVPNGWFAGLLISSAGYLGTTLFGTLLLIWMRYGFSSRTALFFAAGYVGVMTIVFGLAFPIFNFLSPNVTVGGMFFTVLAGSILTAGLFATARYASIKWVDFAIAFLAVQCLLNSLFSLRDLFVLSASTDVHTDAVNMASATGIPAILWVFVWMLLAIVMISVGLRLFAVKNRSTNDELPFAD